MPSTTSRLRFWGDPDRVAVFDAEGALQRARRRLRELRGAVQLLQIEQSSADSVDVAIGVAPASGENLDEIAVALQEALGIGNGPWVELPDPGEEEVRGIGGQGRACPVCKQTGGRHVPGCPRTGS
jgi:hypothetical protein